MMESQLPQGHPVAGGDDETGSPDQQQQPQQSGNENPPPETTDAASSSSTVHDAAVSPTDGGDGGNAKIAPSSAAAVAKASRKRTKTGCLTCRKRRIKCGEERPTCANCIKSKRVCEGYNQRVVFKDGMNGMYRPGMMGAAGGSMDRRLIQPYPIQPAPAPGSGSALQPIAPAPPVNYRQPEPVAPLDQSKPSHLRRVYEEQQHMQQQQQQQQMFHGLGQQNPLTSLGDTLGHQGQFQQQGSYNQPQQVPVTQGHDQGAQQYISYYPQVPNPVAGETLSGSPTSGDRPQFSAPIDSESAPSVFGSGPSSGVYTSTPITPYAPPHPSATNSSDPCPFNPPIDRKYAVASGGEQFNQPVQELGGMFRNNENLIRRSPP
ncbi:hypothetical protein HOY82DRAFT_344771 [Tuber indicum]|nr:hypothetical protein HOY82DRAFT_344771 [Tuber indicum]